MLFCKSGQYKISDSIIQTVIGSKQVVLWEKNRACEKHIRWKK